MLAGVAGGSLWRLHSDGGRLSDGELGAFVASLVLTPVCLVCLRLNRVAGYVEKHPSRLPPAAVAEWREAIRLPVIVAAAFMMIFVIGVAAEFARSDVPRSTSLALVAVLGIGSLASLPGSWMAARNVAAQVPASYSLGLPLWVRGLMCGATGVVLLFSFKLSAEPTAKSIPSTPPSYCYPYDRVQQAIDEGLSQGTVGELVGKGEIAPETLCFTSPLPAGPYGKKPTPSATAPNISPRGVDPAKGVTP